MDISPINQSEIGLICTNLANELGHHLVGIQTPFVGQIHAEQLR